MNKSRASSRHVSPDARRFATLLVVDNSDRLGVFSDLGTKEVGGEKGGRVEETGLWERLSREKPAVEALVESPCIEDNGVKDSSFMTERERSMEEEVGGVVEDRCPL